MAESSEIMKMQGAQFMGAEIQIVSSCCDPDENPEMVGWPVFVLWFDRGKERLDYFLINLTDAIELRDQLNSLIDEAQELRPDRET